METDSDTMNVKARPLKSALHPHNAAKFLGTDGAG